MKQCIIQLSQNNGDVVSCLADECGNQGLGLNESGITWNEENSPVRLEIAHDEVQITRIDSDVEAVLERNGRTLNLKKDKSVRVLSNDEIKIGASRFSVRRIFKGTSEKVKSALKSLRGAGTAAMLVMAASLMLPICGCDSDDKDNTEVVPEVLEGSIADVPCYEKTGQDLKACCEKIDNESRRAECCDRLASEGEGLRCDVPEVTAGSPVYIAPCDGKSGKDLKTCCEALDDKYERNSCCERLEKQGYGLVCEDKPDIPEIVEGEMLPPVCSDVTGKELKACCEALDPEGSERANCCTRLAQEKSGFTCESAVEIPEIIEGDMLPPACYDKSGKELKACCEALEDESERADCCDRLASEKSGLTCESTVEIPEILEGDMLPPACYDKSGKDLKACCEALTDEFEKADCCDRLASENKGLKCEEEVIVPEETGGVIAIPACYEKTGKTLKACCEALDAGSERDACCARLEKEKSGFACFKDGEEM